MTPGEFESFAKTMRTFGISKLKMSGIEIELQGHIEKFQEVKSPEPEKIYPDSTEAPLGGLPSTEDPVKHKIEEFASLMKLNDRDLVDKLFPEPIKEDDVNVI